MGSSSDALALLTFVLLYINDREQKSYYQELSNSHSAALESMVLVAGTKDFETGAHLTRTKEYMKLATLNAAIYLFVSDRAVSIKEAYDTLNKF